MGKENELTFLQKASIQWNSFRKFLWNSEEKTVLGRNGKSWAQISLFYLVFYACLAIFWAIMLIVFLQTITEDKPKWTSYIGTPGLYQIPQPEEKLNMIRFNMKDEKSYEKYTKPMRKLYDQYVENMKNSDAVNCTDGGVRPDDRDTICEFDIEEAFGDGVCNPENDFGYKLGTPCIFIGLNRVWGWEPENYDEDDVPKEIVDNGYMKNFITIGCEVYKDVSTQLNNTEISPKAGISFKYYPYLGAANDNYKNDYVSPLVAVRFSLFKKNTEVRLVCKSYAANITPGTGLFDTGFPSELRLDLTINTK
ncbi:sodium/potassium-transporting ATPase subunit beta-1-like [Antedon mediterranea]|uniref:sodium/potassium-transporting ATPase subunit beta-1-like n=1 Tax=Antedon mediterranea TaxID=105859 RepID=UPI003AF91508